MDLRTLKSFIAVAELKNFSAAARELHMVQPAISRQISDLESELGVSLFWRNTREVRITEPGKVLLRQARELLHKAEEAKEAVQRCANGEIGEVRIGYLPSPCIGFLPDVVRGFSERFPNVDIQLKEMTAQEQIDAFDNGQLDIGFSRPLPALKQEAFASTLIYNDHLFAVLPETHRLAGNAQVSLAELVGERFILFKREEAIGLFDQIISVCKQHGFSPEISNQPENMQTILTRVAAGLGVSIVPGCVANLLRAGCVFKAIEGVEVTVPLELHSKKHQHSVVATHFREAVCSDLAAILQKVNISGR